MYDYETEREDEMTVKEGDIVEVVDKEEQEGEHFHSYTAHYLDS